MALPEQATISSVVTDASGHGLSSAHIGLVRAIDQRDPSAPPEVVVMLRAGLDGRWSARVPKGTYLLQVRQCDFAVYAATIAFEEDREIDVVLRPEKGVGCDR